MTMQKDISKTPIIWEPLSAGLPTAFIRHPFLSKALPICWRKTTERTPITADYPAFTRRYGNRFLLHSPDMEGGYPGNVQAEVEYQFTETNELTISYHGTTDRPTYLNLTNHAYFNLSGNKRKITEHELMIPAARILETTSQFIPTGQAQDVKDSPFDFSTCRSIGAHLYDDNEQLHWNKGYNHCYILKEESSDTLLTAAVLSDPFSGRRLTVRTDLPGVLLYTAGYLAPTPDIGVCLETQYFPDTPSHPHFPSCLLMPGEEYRHRTIYTFDK